ncbi:uncharacterized protein LOC105356970 isoform X2 [Oryzias latipes]|uniref:uncharacterized protein LOC105356970 isoform X2 n=1 Tax=Oryzias latipes TaxID=8090 RepID=UPI0005CBAFE8|nr:uncharacterized protein LOC105356970 isoform X2 [Oryzias latipes]
MRPRCGVWFRPLGPPADLLLRTPVSSTLSAAVFSYKPLYKRVGEDAVLPCSVERRSNRDVYWVISRLRRAASEQMSCTANVEQTAASRLSVNSSCSLLIRNVTEEDAGRYVCRDRQDYYNYIPVFLEVLTNVGGRVDLRCSLLSFHELHVCEGSTIIWMNQTGSELSAKNPQFELQRPTKCVSVLTVEHQSGNHQTFTCQFVKDKQVKTEAVYLLTDTGEQTKHLNYRVGEEVLLPCRTTSSSSSCSDVTWLHQKGPDEALRPAVHKGSVVRTSAAASRLSVSSDGSLLIRSITEEDAGRYLLRLGNKNELDVYLHILSNLSGHIFIILAGAVVKVVLVFLGLIAALVCMARRRTKGNEDQRTRTSTFTLRHLLIWMMSFPVSLSS